MVSRVGDRFVSTQEGHAALRRLIGPGTAFLVGLGVAIGSGIFRTPGLVAKEVGSPSMMVLLWIVGGLFVLASSLVSAELATRFPRAGGEYAYLREAYGDFVAFFFGWAYTVFIIGGGAATIAAATGEALVELIGLPSWWQQLLAVFAVILVTALNALGLRVGAAVQNLLTALKVGSILLVAIVAFAAGGDLVRPETRGPPVSFSWVGAILAALPPVLWAYDGLTDSVKLAEEVRDPRRDLPRALIGSAVVLTALYVLVNVAYLAVLTPAQMAESRFVANDVLASVLGSGGRRLMCAISVVVFLGALSSTLLATIRVTFALARDGLGFRFMARMSSGQAPVSALLSVGVIAAIFAAYRDFGQILDIYFLASAVLFGLAYGSLIVFRLRDARAGQPFPKQAFRCPLGPVLASILIVLQFAIVVEIVATSPRDSLYTVALLGLMAIAYFLWKRRMPQRSPSTLS